ncbi:hypothetical protein [Bartonella krasnovii]|uniref:Uncharacterized protein n=1 Tax=Bartonella krasnovii TaxID=2267275 RepID=A0ABY3VTZ5_9HYPH|nr:hypothetical protein [Bartonella krasnovii]UNF28847.1 hypothetical protein MNL13_06480 [Bartonella krasnovii]UNF35217.1 hypothetical protein MNL12_06465 [Bartonella krasnovii]UNF36845.1 hypothetical protein MNL11_07140 [Bartonella krasnovii]UNF38531.1 hypothetical protein MNL10_07330 [Bartonella krasnovii]UNF40259.1 hypothetical protein MNL09_07410 [Bartonella krasnovii]
MHNEMASAYTIALMTLLGGLLDLFLMVPIVALYISFIKRLISYYKVTRQLNAALKKRV